MSNYFAAINGVEERAEKNGEGMSPDPFHSRLGKRL